MTHRTCARNQGPSILCPSFPSFLSLSFLRFSPFLLLLLCLSCPYFLFAFSIVMRNMDIESTLLAFIMAPSLTLAHVWSARLVLVNGVGSRSPSHVSRDPTRPQCMILLTPKRGYEKGN
ncbi:hypothetical protein QBC37DRAFT_142343 [Rhypophila decipiens]|uniref:Uncharacterized protein n=1 Tax=Rhypophila decipiens TaxID=261697 RepID=A0AAN7B0W3_9PEZI|nr:hypothetical protein QBC37DRAFT_142343 [Rhypophila decipiens]